MNASQLFAVRGGDGDASHLSWGAIRFTPAFIVPHF